MNIEFTGLPALLMLPILAALIAFPVKISATMFGSPNATLLRSFMSLIISLGITMAAINVFPPIAFIAPLILVFILMHILDIGFFAAFGVAIMTAVLFTVFSKLLITLIPVT